MKNYRSHIEKLRSLFDKLPEEYIHQYIHDLYLYDRGSRINKFFKQCDQLKNKYEDPSHLHHALRILVRSYFVKDEVFVSHLMLSPVEKYKKQLRFKDMGESFIVTHINRPHFDFLGMKIEFDINPKEWMLGFMRHMRILRILLPTWHSKERKIASQVQKKLLKVLPDLEQQDIRKELQKLENIKGYRDIRYAKADNKLSESHA